MKGYTFLLGKHYFSNDKSQNYLVFHPLLNTVKLLGSDFTKATSTISLCLYTE